MAAALEALRPFAQLHHRADPKRSGLWPPVQWRIQQLELLREAVRDLSETIAEALFADLRRDRAQALVTEVATVFGEIDVCIENVAKWAQPTEVPTPHLLQPATSTVHPQPKGVMLILGAWNYPFAVTLGPLICAIAAGNCAVVKPSELSPASARVLQQIVQRLDPRAFQAVLGGADVANELCSQPFDHIVYTGGPRVAKLVLAAAAPNLVPVTLELGGKCPVVVLQGADVKECARRVVFNKFLNAGQTCIAPDYALVDQHLTEQFVRHVVECIEASFGPDPKASPALARLVHAPACERLRSILLEPHGARVACGGGDLVDVAQKYVPPTVLVDPKAGAACLTEELFGPVLPVVTVPDAPSAIRHVNSLPKPLGLYVFAKPDQAQVVVDQTSSGGAVINDLVVHKGNPELPFGGVGNSGMGRLHGKWGFDEFTHFRGVMHRSIRLKSPLAHPIPAALAEVTVKFMAFRSRIRPWKLLLLIWALFCIKVRFFKRPGAWL